MPARRSDVSRRAIGGASGVGDAYAYLVTCEHGGNAIPARYRSLFAEHAALLASHRGYDPGALSTAQALARALDAPLIGSTTSRLLVELNRSPGRQFRASPVMCDAPRALRDEVTQRFYIPYRREVETFVRAAAGAGRRVLHVSSHTFTPTLDATARRGDVGLLYDPSRRFERALCLRWQQALQRALPGFIVRRNYPYLGRSDGLTSYLRHRFTGDEYLGIELEVNQKHVRNGALPVSMRAAIVAALRQAVAEPLAA